MEFKSQIATTVEQSKRLMELGLKKETADMYYTDAALPFVKDELHLEAKSYVEVVKNTIQLSPFTFIPAWSLHRLMEILPFEPCLKNFNTEFQYDAMLIHIANAIGSNNINPEYLENK